MQVPKKFINFHFSTMAKSFIIIMVKEQSARKIWFSHIRTINGSFPFAKVKYFLKIKKPPFNPYGDKLNFSLV